MEIASVYTGVAGLDTVLREGLPAKRTYLIRGGPGSGKTTLGMHFLAGQTGACQLITMGEDAAQLRDDARRIGLDLDDVTILDASPSGDDVTEARGSDIFPSMETERSPLIDRIVESVREVRPEFVFIDSLTQFRYLAPDAFQFRKQVLTLMRFLTGMGATVLFASEGGAEAPDEDLQFIADGIIEVRRTAYRREIEVQKLRGADYASGAHTLRVGATGMTVYPRLVPDAHRQTVPIQTVSLGLGDLDALLGGGLETGTVTMISGPTGVGKTTLGMHIAEAAASRGDRVAVYSFEENSATLRKRCADIGQDLEPLERDGLMSVFPVAPLRHTPDELDHMVRREVEANDTRLVMIDSLQGYNLAMQGEHLVERLHGLLRYLLNMGVTVLVSDEISTVTGESFQVSERGISFLADTVIVLRYLELRGEMRKAIGVLKKRTGDFERTLREFAITSAGVRVGPPLTQLRGIISGIPEVVDPDSGPDT